ncbi:MAG: hypothetical protein K2X91_09965 [Thermoleophilia bacterium]|nr:hypothetical protein [Thermoleophilia bacterium]
MPTRRNRRRPAAGLFAALWIAGSLMPLSGCGNPDAGTVSAGAEGENLSKKRFDDTPPAKTKP